MKMYPQAGVVRILLALRSFQSNRKSYFQKQGELFAVHFPLVGVE